MVTWRAVWCGAGGAHPVLPVGRQGQEGAAHGLRAQGLPQLRPAGKVRTKRGGSWEGRVVARGRSSGGGAGGGPEPAPAGEGQGHVTQEATTLLSFRLTSAWPDCLTCLVGSCGGWPMRCSRSTARTRSSTWPRHSSRLRGRATTEAWDAHRLGWYLTHMTRPTTASYRVAARQRLDVEA